MVQALGADPGFGVWFGGAGEGGEWAGGLGGGGYAPDEARFVHGGLRGGCMNGGDEVREVEMKLSEERTQLRVEEVTISTSTSLPPTLSLSLSYNKVSTTPFDITPQQTAIPICRSYDNADCERSLAVDVYARGSAC